MADQPVVLMQCSRVNAKKRGYYLVRGRLACGHWGEWVHEASSTWDFPMEEQHCSECKAPRYFNVDLQVRIIHSIEFSAGEYEYLDSE